VGMKQQLKYLEARQIASDVLEKLDQRKRAWVLQTAGSQIGVTPLAADTAAIANAHASGQPNPVTRGLMPKSFWREKKPTNDIQARLGFSCVRR